MQANRMMLPISSSLVNTTIEIPTSAFSATTSACSLLLLPILYAVVYPVWRPSDVCFGLSLFRRMGLGMILALLGSVCAMVVEYERCAPGMWPAGQYPGADVDGLIYISRLSIFYQLPQYVLIGMAQVFTFVSGK